MLEMAAVAMVAAVVWLYAEVTPYSLTSAALVTIGVGQLFIATYRLTNEA